MLTIDGAQAGTQTKNYSIKFHWKRHCAVVLQLNFTTYLLLGAYCSHSQSLSRISKPLPLLRLEQNDEERIISYCIDVSSWRHKHRNGRIGINHDDQC